MTDENDALAPKESTASANAPVARKEKPQSGNKDGKAAKNEKTGVPNAVWMGTAVGIGSAALVAALMYAKRRK